MEVQSTEVNLKKYFKLTENNIKRKLKYSDLM